MSINSITLSDEEGQEERAPNRRISSPFLGVFAVAAAGVCVHFPTWWTHYLNSVSAAGPVHTLLSPLFLELRGIQLTAAMRGFRRDADHDAGRPVLGILYAREPGGRGPLVTSWG